MHKPVVILQFYPSEGPGYLADFLNAKGIDWQLVRVDLGERWPASVQACAALVMMGGPMSVNDDLPWIEPLLAFVRDAQMAEVPMLGHCLGGQLIAKALGAAVTRNAVREVGWGAVMAADSVLARAYVGPLAQFDVFHWHGETFDLPAGAELILSSPYCAHQAFVLGKTLAMQCHIEMTAELVRAWCETDGNYAREAAESPSVQLPEEMLRHLDGRIVTLNAMADRIYTQWAECAGLLA